MSKINSINAIHRNADNRQGKLSPIIAIRDKIPIEGVTISRQIKVPVASVIAKLTTHNSAARAFDLDGSVISRPLII